MSKKYAKNTNPHWQCLMLSTFPRQKKMVTRTRLMFTLYMHCLSCFEQKDSSISVIPLGRKGCLTSLLVTNRGTADLNTWSAIIEDPFPNILKYLSSWPHSHESCHIGHTLSKMGPVNFPILHSFKTQFTNVLRTYIWFPTWSLPLTIRT